MWREVINMEWEKQDHATKIRVSQVVPSLNPYANWGYPMGLGLNINPPFKVREQNYNQSPSFFQVTQ